MVNRKHLSLIESLLDQTRKGLLEWKEHPQENTFQLSFPQYSLTISAGPGDHDSLDYYVQIINQAGIIVDAFSDVELNGAMTNEERANSTVFASLREIYDTARRIALGSEKAVDDILEYLNNNDFPF